MQEVCKNEYFINEKTDTPLREQLHGPDKYEVTGMLGLKIHFNMSSLEMDWFKKIDRSLRSETSAGEQS